MKYLFVLLGFLFSQSSFAHVKWFSDYDFQQAPLQFTDLFSTTFWGLFLLSVVAMPIMVYLDGLANKSAAYQKIDSFLDRYSDNGPLIMRVAMGAVLLMSWQGDSIVAPEIAIPSAGWGWLQLLLAILLLFKETTFITGLGIVAFWFIGIGQHGFFHMLDYVVYPAVGIYLAVSYSKIEKLKNIDLPVLYSGLGFSLCWVAFEKLIYPHWGLSVLGLHPALTMGLDPKFFLMACAFIEFSLGYLLVICLLHRPLAIVITLVFFITTSFFGKTEVVGHTILHGALLVFIVKGPGHYYQAPIRFHKNLWIRALFAAVNFVILFFVLAWPYQKMANSAHIEAEVKQAALGHGKFEVSAENAPSVMIHPSQDKNGGWNIHFMTQNFKFTPENAGAEDVVGEGHGHIYLNGTKIGRVYGNWIHLSVPKGKNKVKITLNTNTHKDYAVNGEVIGAEMELDESREVSQQHHH